MLLFWQCCNSVTSINLIKYKIQRQTTFHFRFSLTRKPWNCPRPPTGIVRSREYKNTHGLYGSLNGVSWRRSSVELSAYESVQWDSFHCKFFRFYTERSLDFFNFFFFLHWRLSGTKEYIPVKGKGIKVSLNSVIAWVSGLPKGLKRALYTKETCVMPPFV